MYIFCFSPHASSVRANDELKNMLPRFDRGRKFVGETMYRQLSKIKKNKNFFLIDKKRKYY